MNKNTFQNSLRMKKVAVVFGLITTGAIILTAMSDMSVNKYSERIPLYTDGASILPIDVRTVEGKLSLDGFREKFDGATVYIEIHDTSLQDTASILLKRIVLKDVSYDSSLQDSGISFSIPVDFEVIEGPDYTIRASIDVNSNDRQDSGDYGTTINYPVLNRGFKDYVDVVLERIG